MAQGPGSTRQNNGPFTVGGFYNFSPFTLVDGQACALQFDVNGNLKTTTIGGGSGSNAAAGPTGAPVPADADYQGVNVGGTLFGVSGFNLASSVSMAVAIVDASGNQITSFGGGMQYADNAASGATPTGTLSMGWDSVNSKVRALKVDASQNLLVNVANTSLSVTQGTSPWVISFTAPQHVIVDSGTVTANQGTANSLVNAWPFEITDGTNGPVAVKAASTAALATDPALVVTTNSSTTANAPSQTSVGASSGSILSANTARREAIVVNTGTTIIYLGLGQTPSAIAYHAALAACSSANDGTGGTFVTDIFKGAINAIGSAGGGTVCVTELS